MRSGLLTSRRGQVFAFGLLLVIATVVLYWPVNSHPFANYDDADYVFDNFHVKSGLHWNTVTWALTTFAAANWHPLTWLSHAADVQFFQLDPGWHHDVNLLLHTLNVVLLFWVLQRVTGCVGRSAMVAALFALHPINVESVAWIAERKNLLSMLFFLLALGAYRWYARKPQGKRYAVMAFLYAMGLMCKPQVITLMMDAARCLAFCSFGTIGHWAECSTWNIDRLPPAFHLRASPTWCGRRCRCSLLQQPARASR
jgi:hypothetical protein